MYLIDHELGFREVQKKEAADFLTHPQRIEIQARLNQIGSCQLTYSNRIDSLALGGPNDETLVPFEMRLEGKFADDLRGKTSAEKKGLFNGYLNATTVTANSITLHYVDPLITLDEKDDPKIWRGDSCPQLNQLIDDLLGSSSERAQQQGAAGSRKTLRSSFTDTPPRMPSGHVNLGATTLQTIEDLSQTHGYFFYLQQDFKSSTEFRVNFFKSDLRKSKFDRTLEVPDLLPGYSYQSGMMSFRDQVQVVHSDGTLKVKMADVAPTSCKSFDRKTKARQDAGFGFVLNEHQPMMNAEEARSYAEAKLSQAALRGGDILTLSTRQYFALGEKLELKDPSRTKHPIASRILGNYLVSEAIHIYQGHSWTNHLKLVRP